MKVPISWLKKYIKVDEGSIDDLLHRLTLAGTEVESVQTQGNWEGIIVGQVSEVSKHPNADRLNLVKVNSGDSELLRSMKLIAKTQQGPKEQYPSMGCSIKWFK